MIVCALSAASSCSLVFIHDSTVSPVCARERCAISSAANSVVDRDVDLRRAARQAEQVLRGAQADVDGAAVEVAHAQVDDAGDGERIGDARPVARR